MNTNPDKLSPIPPKPEAPTSGTLLPEWLVRGWDMTAGSLSPAQREELEVAMGLIDAAQKRGIEVTLDDLRVHFPEEALEAAATPDDTPLPVLGTIEDKVVPHGEFPISDIEGGTLGIDGLARQVRPSAPTSPPMPPTAGVTS